MKHVAGLGHVLVMLSVCTATAQPSLAPTSPTSPTSTKPKPAHPRIQHPRSPYAVGILVGGHKVTSAPHVLPLLVGLRVDRTLWQTRESFPIPAKLQAHAGVGMLARRETYDDGTCIDGCYTGDWTLGALAEAGVAIGVLGLYGDRWGVEFLLGPTLLGDTTKEGAGLEVYADMGISLLWLSRHNHQWSLQSHLLVGPGSATDTIGDDKVTAFALVTRSL